MQNRLAIALLVALATWAPAWARAAAPAEQIDKLLAEWDRSDAPGVAVAVVRDGQVLYRRGFGLASLELDAPIRPDSVFYIASLSKQFTAASVLLAEQAGHLKLDDPVRKYVPEMPPYAAAITVRHLMHHTSGLRDYLWLMQSSGMGLANTYSEDDLLRLIARQSRLNFQPGDEFLYSNSGYLLLATIVRRATGKSLRDFADEHIFRPLGMAHTHFHDDRAQVVKNRVVAYERRGDGYQLNWIPHWDKVGDGNLLTTLDDLVLWDANFDSGRVGGADFLRRQREITLLNDGGTNHYAAGLLLEDYRGLATIGHGGAFMGFRTDMIRIDNPRLTVVCLANVAHANPHRITRQIVDLLLADRLQPAAQTVAFVEPDRLVALAGLYRDPVSHGVLKATARDGGVTVELGGRRIELRPTAKDELSETGGPFTARLEFDAQRSQARPRWRVRMGDLRRNYEPIAEAHPTPDDLRELVGAYHSADLQATYDVQLDNDRLVVLRSTGPRLRLTPTAQDQFRAGDTTIEFVRDAAGRPSGFALHTVPARGIVFERQPEAAR